MSSSDNDLPVRAEDAIFGFLSVIELPELGYCGGLLVVSAIGRPIEFHCTAPLKINRTQQILYGQTYQGFLLGDQIATALIEKVKSPPTAFVTDNVELLELKDPLGAPLFFLDAGESEDARPGDGLIEFDAGEHRCWRWADTSPGVAQTASFLDRFAQKLPLDEPIERICQAIEEAHSVLKAG